MIFFDHVAKFDFGKRPKSVQDFHHYIMREPSGRFDERKGGVVGMCEVWVMRISSQDCKQFATDGT
jgi:hypothetical protein